MTEDAKALELMIPLNQWEAIGPDEDDPWTRILLTGGLFINTIPFHVEGWRVHWEGSNEVQEADIFAEEFDAIHDALGADGPFLTLTVNNSPYVVFITPHCQ